MAKLKRCDLCGAEADEMMNIDFPYKERWMLFFHKEGFYHYADVCMDCLAEVRRLREEQIEAENVDIEVVEQTEPSDWKDECERCEYGRNCDVAECKGCCKKRAEQTEPKGESDEQIHKL